MTDYPAPFQLVWDAYRMACSPASFGSKLEAYKEWKKIVPAPDPDVLIAAMHVQKKNDRYRASIKEFVPSWKHCCRWIKWRCWEDVVDISAELNRKKQVLEEAKQDRKKPIPPEQLVPENVDIGEQWKQMLERKRNEKTT